MRKKIIVSASLLLLLSGILLIRLGTRPQSSPDRVSAPSVSAGATPSATTAQYSTRYTLDNSTPVKAKNNDRIELNGKKAVVQTDDVSLYVIQKDGTIDERYDGNGYIYDIFQAQNCVYYAEEDYDDFETTLYRVPIHHEGEKTALQSKKQKLLKTDTYRISILYATDQYVIYSTDDDIIKYTVKSKKSEHMNIPCDEDFEISWSCIYGPNQEPIMEKEGVIYIREDIDEIEGLGCDSTFYKIDTDTFQKTKLSDRTTDILTDSSGQIVIIESDKTWNYAYYPETGKRIRCSQNMMKEWGPADGTKYFAFGDIPAADNRDLVRWIRHKNPWDYLKKDGVFSCLNHFIYDDRMYVSVNFEWKEAQEAINDENAYMLFSYSLKNYQGIRPETELNRIMQKYSSRTRKRTEESSSYYYCNVTGRFSFLFNDILVFDYDDFYVLYHLGTGEYHKIGGKDKDALYLKELYQ